MAVKRVKIGGLEETDDPVRFIYYHFPTGRVLQGQFEKDLRPLGLGEKVLGLGRKDGQRRIYLIEAQKRDYAWTVTDSLDSSCEEDELRKRKLDGEILRLVLLYFQQEQPGRSES